MSETPRQPRNLQGLIKFCMTAGQDFCGNDVKEMDEERRQWLREALESMTVDVIKLMKDNIRIILTDMKDSSDAAISRKEEALTTLCNIVDELDLANDFVKLGGLNLLLTIIDENNNSPTIRELACECLATVCQNNPFAQTEAVEQGCIESLLSQLKLYRVGMILPKKQLYALSAIIRGHPIAMARFEQEGGIDVLMWLFKTYSDESILTKITFVLKALFADDEKIAFSPNHIATLCEKLTSTSHQAYHEHILALLIQLSQLTNGRALLQESLNENLVAIKESLEGRIKHLDQQPEHEETVQYSIALLQILSTS